ncbi:probable ethanolamine kinase [Camellia sinensis]|uniref:probable ethanolamine kinase n=1 Tax=Camellia sinensis TaxID=4442 RepID=UPI00103668C6|nr:probable ethanolamine kinase [Camellia sinensis]XP_028074758.1 probable ethanolamine kinase [Camellia sinensis]
MIRALEDDFKKVVGISWYLWIFVVSFLLLNVNDMRKPKLAAEIAKQLRRFHQVEIPGFREPQLWNEVFKFFKKASTLKFDDSEKQRKYETISFEEVEAEVVKLKVFTLLMTCL